MLCPNCNNQCPNFKYCIKDTYKNIFICEKLKKKLEIQIDSIDEWSTRYTIDFLNSEIEFFELKIKELSKL